eukprot:SAG11_NODE_225_length_12064_cov_7.850815_18_plen_202_part_00
MRPMVELHEHDIRQPSVDYQGPAATGAAAAVTALAVEDVVDARLGEVIMLLNEESKKGTWMPPPTPRAGSHRASSAPARSTPADVVAPAASGVVAGGLRKQEHEKRQAPELCEFLYYSVDGVNVQKAARRELAALVVAKVITDATLCFSDEQAFSYKGWECWSTCKASFLKTATLSTLPSSQSHVPPLPRKASHHAPRTED